MELLGINDSNTGVAFFPLARAHYSVPTSQRCCNIAQLWRIFFQEKLSDKKGMELLRTKNLVATRIGVAFFQLACAYLVPTSQCCCNIAQSCVLTNFLSRKLSDKGRWSYYVPIFQMHRHFFKILLSIDNLLVANCKFWQVTKHSSAMWKSSDNCI